MKFSNIFNSCLLYDPWKIDPVKESLCIYPKCNLENTKANLIDLRADSNEDLELHFKCTGLHKSCIKKENRCPRCLGSVKFFLEWKSQLNKITFTELEKGSKMKFKGHFYERMSFPIVRCKNHTEDCIDWFIVVEIKGLKFIVCAESDSLYRLAALVEEPKSSKYHITEKLELKNLYSISNVKHKVNLIDIKSIHASNIYNSRSLKNPTTLLLNKLNNFVGGICTAKNETNCSIIGFGGSIVTFNNSLAKRDAQMYPIKCDSDSESTLTTTVDNRLRESEDLNAITKLNN